MKKWMRAGIVVVLAAAVTGGAYWKLRPTQATAATAVSTAPVRRGTLTATISAAGNIQAHRSADLSFGQSGVVRTINVKVGDRVKAGDVLAETDTSELALSLRSAQVGLKNAQAQLAQVQNPNTEQDIANARAQLDSAQAAYDKAAAGPTQSELATARAQVVSAQASYDAAVKSAAASDSSLMSAAASLEKALVTLQAAQGDYDRVSWRGDVAASSQSQALQTATIDYETAKANYDAIAATSKTDAASKVASAASSLASAKANLAELQNQDNKAELASAQAALTQAKNNLAELLAGPDANSLDISQNGVESAQISVDQAKLKLAQAQVTAPFDGVVTAVNVKIGQSASGTAVTLADLDHLEIVVNMAEVDVNQMKIGQVAGITLDALADVTLKGAVSQIAPAGVQSSGVVNYPVTVALDEVADGVKTGMTANLNIIVDQRADVLMVPNRAVRTANRQKVVSLMVAGQQVPTPVQTGLSNETMTEITNGVREGDVVVLTGTTTATGLGNRLGGMPGGVMQFEGPPPGR